MEANARFLSTAQWCDEVASTLTLLGGLSLLHVAPGAVHLKLVTPFPTGPVRGDDPGPCTTADHELSLHLSDDGAGGLHTLLGCSWVTVSRAGVWDAEASGPVERNRMGAGTTCCAEGMPC